MYLYTGFLYSNRMAWTQLIFQVKMFSGNSVKKSSTAHVFFKRMFFQAHVSKDMFTVQLTAVRKSNNALWLIQWKREIEAFIVHLGCATHHFLGVIQQIAWITSRQRSTDYSQLHTYVRARDLKPRRWCWQAFLVSLYNRPQRNCPTVQAGEAKFATITWGGDVTSCWGRDFLLVCCRLIWFRRRSWLHWRRCAALELLSSSCSSRLRSAAASRRCLRFPVTTAWCRCCHREMELSGRCSAGVCWLALDGDHFHWEEKDPLLMCKIESYKVTDFCNAIVQIY